MSYYFTMNKKKLSDSYPSTLEDYKREYDEHQKFEKLITSLSSDLASDLVTVESENQEKVIHRWMVQIGQTLEAEISVIFRRDTLGSLYISDYWRKNDTTTPKLYDPSRVFPYLTSMVLKGQIVSVSSIDDLPAEAETDKENLKKFGTKSFLFFPLGMGNHVLGAFLFAYKTRSVSWKSAFVNKLGFVVHIFSAVIRREYDLEKLKERIRYERLLSDLSRDFATTRVNSIGEKITYWLHESAAILGADRALIFKIDNNNKFSLTTAWRSKEGNAIIPYDPEELFPWMSSQLRNNKPVIIPNLSAFPEEGAKDRNSMSVIGALSVLVLPLFLKDTIAGAIAFSSTQPQFHLTEDLVQRFWIISQVFANALLREKTEGILEEERERLAVTLKSIGDGVITTDTSGKITLLNTAAEELTGWPLKEAKGQPIDKIFHIIDENTGKERPSPVEKVLKTESVVNLANHTLLIDKKGIRKVIADSGAPIKDSKGSIIGVVLVFRDITMESEREADILKLKKLESIGILAGGIAHDFNNILTGIMGNINLAIMSSENSDEEHNYLVKSLKGCERAASLTNKLLTFSKGGSPVKENASIDEIVTESIEFILHGSQIKTNTFIQDGLWTPEVDRNQISQVIQNLILNSVESMPRGGIISVACINKTFEKMHPRHGNYVQITIEDTGAGISEKNLEKIFDPYFSTKKTGSGLGLAVTHSIIHKHGGFIDVHSREGEGTIFTIFLPVFDTQKSIHPQPMQTNPAKEVKNLSILVMDDEEAIRILLKNMLEKIGHTATLVENGEQAIEAYRKEKFDLVILDVTIPGGMGGIETVKELKAIDPQVKALVSSGYANSPILSDSAAYGFSAALEKPYLLNELKTAIEKLFC